ncbi:unannotated protein [freshwater metagenome]|uniref:Unannotated protein n=1 Tax=freshwater metagenome TaxID=449393 RepID=A0A6J7LIH5_9ZZZZ
MMRAVPFVVVMLLTGCSFAGAEPVPSVSAVNVSQPASPSAAPVEVLRLKSQESVRGAEVLVPAGWPMDGTDGGGSGSMSVWTDPANEGSWIAVRDGMELGAWLETDGVTGSVDPAEMLPEGAEVVRESRTVFRYSIADPSTGLPEVRGAWIAGVDEVSGQADGYEQVEVSLLVLQDSVVEDIIHAFIEQAKARFAGGAASAGGVGDMGQSEDGSPGQSAEPAGAGFEFPSRSVQSEIVRRLGWTGNPLCLEIQLAQSSSDWGLRWSGDYARDHPDECFASDGISVVTKQGDAWVSTGAGGSVFGCSEFEPGGMFATIGAPPSVMRDLRAEFLDNCMPDE